MHNVLCPLFYQKWRFIKQLQVLHVCNDFMELCSRGYKIFSCSTKLRMTFILLINVKKPTIVGILILTFGSMTNTAHSTLKAGKVLIFQHFSFCEQLKLQAQLSWAWKKFYNLEARSSVKRILAETLLHANNKATKHSTHPRSLISTFIIRSWTMLKCLVCFTQFQYSILADLKNATLTSKANGYKLPLLRWCHQEQAQKF